mgnify:CR=1 FL=1|tara:strand:- start:80 stop:319 length:240 start_codon:yes stop_codon:yes gene_type:complete
MAHVVISVSPETKSRLDVLRNEIEEKQGFKLSYSDVVKMLLKTYEQQQETVVEEKNDNQVEMDFEEKPEEADIFQRYRG